MNFALTLKDVTDAEAKVATYTNEQLEQKFFETLGMIGVEADTRERFTDIYPLIGLVAGHLTIAREIQIRQRGVVE